MLNSYYIRSHISAKKFRKLVGLFVRRAKITYAAKELNLEPKTIRDIFRRIRRRLEAECWERISFFHPGIMNSSFPFQVLHPAVRLKAFQTSGDDLPFPAAVVALLFRNETVTTSMLMVRRSRLDSGKFPVDTPDSFSKTGLDRDLLNCGFADLWFASKGALINSETDYLQTFWLYTRLHTSQLNRRNSDKFYLHLKELEWSFNILTRQERADVINHLQSTTVKRGAKRKGNLTIGSSENEEIEAIYDNLSSKLLELLERNPLKCNVL